MYKNNKHTSSNALKTKALSVLFGMLTIFMFAQKSAENTFLKTNSTQKAYKNINKSTFFSDTPIFVAENSVFSLQLENLQFNKDVFGEGLLHIANTPVVTVVSLTPLHVAHVELKHTQLSLYSELQLTGAVKLINATILLNEFNLITEKEVLFNDNFSKVLAHSTGIWIRPQTSLSKSLPYLPTTSNNNNIITALFYTNTIHINKLSALACKIESKSTLKEYNFYQVPKPPPKIV